jgi:hypothetical protein
VAHEVAPCMPSLSAPRHHPHSSKKPGLWQSLGAAARSRGRARRKDALPHRQRLVTHQAIGPLVGYGNLNRVGASTERRCDINPVWGCPDHPDGSPVDANLRNIANFAQVEPDLLARPEACRERTGRKDGRPCGSSDGLSGAMDRALVEAVAGRKEGERRTILGVEWKRTLRPVGLLAMMGRAIVQPRAPVADAPRKHSADGARGQRYIEELRIGGGHLRIAHDRVTGDDVFYRALPPQVGCLEQHLQG